MQTEALKQIAGAAHHAPTPFELDDPIGKDLVDDVQIAATRRGLLRLALVATETASRFSRDGITTDPMAWMLTPRRLFDGRAAIDACLGRDECLRAIVLHGLSIGLDADPGDIDSLATEDEELDDEVVQAEMTSALVRSPRLWTSLFVGHSAAGAVQAFDALIADDRAEAELRLRARHRGAHPDDVEIVEGFDASLPLVEALVSPALADMLEQIAAHPASPLADGLSVSVKQSFAN